MLDCVFVGKRTDSTLSSHTFSWSQRAGITLSRPRRSINFDREQSANAMWCHSAWWQLCGEWRHADRCGSVSVFSFPSARRLLYLNDKGKVWGSCGPFPSPQISWTVLPWMYPRVQCKAAFCVLIFIRWPLFESWTFPSWTKGSYNPVISFKIS